jgi:hypothetical protein
VAGFIRIAVGLVNAGNVKAQLVGISSTAGKVGDKFSKFRAPAIAALAGISAGALKAIHSASDLNESLSKTDQIFGKQSASVKAWAQTTDKSMGLSTVAALDAASTFGLMGKKAGLSGTETAKFAQKFTGLAGDLASFNNTTPEQAIEAIGAAMRGEGEPIRKYGVLLDDATLKARAMAIGLVKASKDSDKIRQAQVGLLSAQQKYNAVMKDDKATALDRTKASSAVAHAQALLGKATAGSIPPLTAQQKALAASAEIMAQTKTAQGDFARTSTGAANASRIQAAEAANLSAQLGQALLPAYTRFLSIGNQVLGFLSQHGKATQIAIVALAGLAIAVLAVSTAQRVAAAVGAVYNAVQAVTTKGTKSYAAAQWLLNAATAAFPIFAIIAGLVLIAAGIIYAYKHSAKFRAVVDGAFKAIKTAVTGVVSFFKALPGWIKSAVGDTAKTLYQKGRGFIVGVVSGVTSYLGTLAAKIGGIVGGVLRWIGNTGSTLYQKGRGLIVGLAQGYVSLIGNVAHFFGGIGSSVIRWVGNLGSALYGAGAAIIRGLLNGIGSMIGALRDKLGSITKLIPKLKGPLDKDRRLLTPAGQAIMDSLIRGMSRQLPELERFLAGTTRSIEGGFAARPSVALAAGAGSPFTASAAAAPIQINVSVLTGGPEAGRAVVKAIRDYELANGTRWRQ